MNRLNRKNQMSHFANILIGIGEAMNPFGTAPQYRYPQAGERAHDAKKIKGDFHQVGDDLSRKAELALRGQYGEVDDCATAR